MSLNHSEICLNARQMQMASNEAEMIMMRYIYPCIVIFGIAGNVLNLTVLLDRSMRTRSNKFLAALAFADIVFLSLLVPNILANYPIFTYSYSFRKFYFTAKAHIISLANWSSAVAMW
ncbi:hypothetical protein AB6A40_009015 [Gnathostoma spinigerum]|uniref:G-protein coupled receptors family 1 profile domain-containing protein n=1 Tax=Gnathostoma spinigerum TaxID=75299 RepID=A0ABD6ESL1_9BILA